MNLRQHEEMKPEYKWVGKNTLLIKRLKAHDDSLT